MLDKGVGDLKGGSCKTITNHTIVGRYANLQLIKMFCTWEIYNLEICLSYLPMRLRIAIFIRRSVELLLLKYKKATFAGK